MHPQFQVFQGALRCSTFDTVICIGPDSSRSSVALNVVGKVLQHLDFLDVARGE
jgi:hypothetical protein